MLTVNMDNGEKISFEGAKNDVSRNEITKALVMLKGSQINLDDPYHILDDLLSTDKIVWQSLQRAE